MKIEPNMKPKVNFLIIGTNNYMDLAKECSNKLKEFGSKELEIYTTIFSNEARITAILDDVCMEKSSFNEHIQIDHLPWPLITLLRYYYFHNNDEIIHIGGGFIPKCEYTYYIDADLHPAKEFGAEILGDRVFTIHPGYYNQPKSVWPTEFDPRRNAFFPRDQARNYYIGAFQGGRTRLFLDMCKILRERINNDLKNNHIAPWHDESHMNRYAFENPPDKELTPSFCYPEGSNLPFEPVFIARNKNHEEIRKE